MLLKTLQVLSSFLNSDQKQLKLKIMENKKYNILVLADLNDATSNILKSSISIAKMINGELNFMCVKSPTALIDMDNQFSALRSLKDKYTLTDKRIKDLIEPIKKEYNININYTINFGNIKNEIKRYISNSKPDIVVLGKKSNKPLKLVGDDITQFILNIHDGPVLLASKNNVLEPTKELSLGMYSEEQNAINLDFADHLMEQTKKPIRSFKLVTNSEEKSTNITNNKEVVEYVFEKTTNSFNTLDAYLAKNNINLFYVDRSVSGEDSKNKNVIDANLKEMIKNIDVSLLIPGAKKYA